MAVLKRVMVGARRFELPDLLLPKQARYQAALRPVIRGCLTVVLRRTVPSLNYSGWKKQVLFGVATDLGGR